MTAHRAGGAGTLHMVPVPLGGEDAAAALPAATLALVGRLRHFIVENEKSARRFLKQAGHPGPLADLAMQRLDEHTPPAGIPRLLDPLREGHDVALLSEAGCPGIADPGARVVEAAHREGLRVVPHVGPSSIVLALMASGMNGQSFAFHGYLPVASDARRRRLRELEQESRRTGATQLFIETPYRNAALLADLLAVCDGTTQLCVATDLTLPTEAVRTATVSEWRGLSPNLERRPTVFLLAGRPAGLSGRAATSRKGSPGSRRG